MPHQRKISVIGLGYVGLTIAAGFGQYEEVIGFDVSETRIAELKNKYDRNGELSPKELSKVKIHLTTDPNDLKRADFHIIAVLTPIDINKMPNFSILLEASDLLAKQLKPGDIVVYESTVYPGATEERCIPLLERVSQLRCGVDFAVGYSPERINPGDKEHTFQTIKKIVSAVNKETLDIIANVYKSVIKAGVYFASSIRVAEATKVIENTQRDINISLMNEIALILHSIGMDTREVLDAAKTKWNYIPIKPGLVGGHCIGVNSYYLTYKAEEVGFQPELILAGRRINNYIPKFIAQTAVKKLIHRGVLINKAKIGILGLTYKENCPDLHYTKVVDIIKELKSFHINVIVHDPIADATAAKKEYGVDLKSWEELVELDAIIITTAHQQYVHLDPKKLSTVLKSNGLIMDMKGILNPELFKNESYTLWEF